MTLFESKTAVGETRENGCEMSAVCSKPGPKSKSNLDRAHDLAIGLAKRPRSSKWQKRCVIRLRCASAFALLRRDKTARRARTRGLLQAVMSCGLWGRAVPTPAAIGCLWFAVMEAV